MSRRAVRPLVAAALLAGVLVGLVVALTVPTRSLSSSPPITVLPQRATKALPDMIVLVPKKGSAAVELRADDPNGGPQFAIRVFRATRYVPLTGRRHNGRGRLLGHDLCAQLGRLYRGRFGWIDAQHRFRPARFNYTDAPLLCGERWDDRRSEPQLIRTTLITNPLLASAQPTESVVWGIAGSLLRGVSLEGGGARTPHPKPSARGAFLSFADPGAPPKLSATFTYAGRPGKRLSLDPARPTPVPPPLNRSEHGIVFGTEQLEARAPDPSGGLAWGIEASRSTKGGYCPWDIGRVVGSRVGAVNYQLGTVSDSHVLPCLMSVRLTRKMPLAIWSTYGGGSDPDIGADPEPGRGAIRTLPGRTTFSGLARPDVREITIETTRDVRTIVPSPRAHAFIVVYDGSFPTGDTVFDVTFTDGTHHVQRLPAAPF
jgi:hypothetical protein